jgi:hypothetical protein
MEQPVDYEDSKKRKRNIIVIITSAIVIIIAAYFIFAAQKVNKSVENKVSNAAAEKLYDALGKAAKQQRIRVGMYRETFAHKADADARRNVGTTASSIGEIDTQAGKYRSVFAYNTISDDGSYSVGRCIDGTTYNDIYASPAKNTQRAMTLEDAATRLNLMPDGNLFKVTEPLVFISCPHIGLMPAAPPLPVTRLSDGIMAVTLSDSQAENWKKKLQSADLFTIKDEGVVERNGAKLRKFSVTPKNDDLTISKRLYDIFTETAEIAKIKSEHPKAEVDYEFQSINPLNSGGVGGFYLIDEDKDLPVYSELYGTNSDKESKRNIARTKQTYSYPSQLTIDLTTSLEFLQ